MAFVCRQCQGYFPNASAELGQWRCRAHPGRVDAFTRQYTCCGLDPAAIDRAPSRAAALGCARADHRASHDLASVQYLPAFCTTEMGMVTAAVRPVGPAGARDASGDPAPVAVLAAATRRFVYTWPTFWATLSEEQRGDLHARADAALYGHVAGHHLAWLAPPPDHELKAMREAVQKATALVRGHPGFSFLVQWCTQGTGFTGSDAAEEREAWADVLAEDAVPVTWCQVARVESGTRLSTAHTDHEHGRGSASSSSRRGDDPSTRGGGGGGSAAAVPAPASAHGRGH